MWYGMLSKICTKCDKGLTIDKFSKHYSCQFGRNSVCKKCDAKRVVKWQKDNPEKRQKTTKKFTDKESTKRYRKNWRLLKHYNITIKDYELLLEKQNGKCAICQKERGLHVDHNHVTGKVRGLLCGQCNKAIGLLKDDCKVLKNAISYLERVNNNENCIAL